ncbi:phosphoribosylformylglycinamidine synthase subunit PurL [Planctomyces sp. SH-PL14]|uniref:phosphoribosylformylglycinamidine synthase subunit PurL n=1 Tax=Planctomyces sp. SH-PL14 TaxID=1632864 RepID=UPI00078D99A7|nr:phosphoribosylformylglycinamidine synthase subunit PurL [Planctomyces sp. SH-PL14]AMV16625.1 Phosphoribosylformylglycinamidine synthase 2 [Planctomyces sp. SH-PL14]
MLWEVEIHPIPSEVDREGARVLAEAHALGAKSITSVRAARSFLVEGNLTEDQVRGPVARLLGDGVAERCFVSPLPAGNGSPVPETNGKTLLNVLFKPGVTDNVGLTARTALNDQDLAATVVATCRKYWLNPQATKDDVDRLARKVLSNDAIEHVVAGPLPLKSIALGTEYRFKLTTVPIRGMDDAALARLSKEGQLYLSLVEMQTIRDYFSSLDRDPTDIELETVAQTWSEHCSHKTLAGRIRYRDENGERRFENMLKETVFAATQELRKRAGADDWCVSVFKDNAGVVKFSDTYDVCMKVETHNHPSALEPYGGANTGLGGVIRDPLGTGLGAKPVCSTDVFCFAPPDTPYDSLPPGVLHPKTVMRGVVSGVRDYGNRMGIPTVNGAVYFDDRYIGNPLVYCGNVALIPVGLWKKHVEVGDHVVAVGGKTGRDGIHGATFSSAELTEESETLSGGAVQIGNAITEKMLMDVILEARDRGLYHAITDCGAGGFSSAVGEMGEETGAEVWLDKCPLKYSGLSYTEIWISEAQERMILAVPPGKWDEFHALCASEGVEATIIGRYTGTERLVLKYQGEEVGNLAMEFLHDGRPPVVREAVFEAQSETKTLTPAAGTSGKLSLGETLTKILGSLNVCSKEWIIRQYDHEVQAGSVVKPLVGVTNDGPSDAAVVRPDLSSSKGLAISCGMNPRFGDLDPYWMAASAIDEAVRNCIAVGADPSRVAILDNFCWGNTERPETLGSLVRAALACHDVAIAYGTPFVSGKDSLNNEFKYQEGGENKVITIPSSLLISALGQLDDIEQAVTMDLKGAGNVLLLVGETRDEMGGSHFALVQGLQGGTVPRVDLTGAPKTFVALHAAIGTGHVLSCHDLSEGGLAVALAEMAFAGGLGVEASLQEALGGLAPETLLFSESNTRFLLEVPASEAANLTAHFAKAGVAAVRIGSVTTEPRIKITGALGAALVNEANADLKEAWQSPLRWG